MDTTAAETGLFELHIANNASPIYNGQEMQRAAELHIAENELVFQNEEKMKRAAELVIANAELLFQNKEKEKRAAELILTNKELLFQIAEKEKRAAELFIANKELIFKNIEKENRAAELIIANKELAFQNEQKEMRATELIIANKELAFQNQEKEKRASELIIANQELAFQNKEKEKRALEQCIALKNIEVAEEMLRIATDSAELGTWYIDHETREFIASPRLKQIFGFKLDEIMPYEAAITQIVKDYQNIVLNAVEDSISKGEKYNLEYPIVGFNDKKIRWVRAIGKLNYDKAGNPSYFTGVVHDITERKQEEEKIKNDQKALIKVKEALAASEEQYRNLIENSGVVMYSASLAGKITFANRKAFELTGYPIAELIGKSFTYITDKDCLEEVKEKYFEQLKNNVRETNYEFCIRTKSNELKYVEQTAVLITEAGLPVGFQCSIKDISQRKEMEEVLRRSEQRSMENQIHLQSILDNTTSLIYIKDLYGKYIIVNKEFKNILKVNDEAVIGKTDFNFTDRALAMLFKKTDDQVIATRRSVEVETEMELDGEKRNLLITKFPLLDAHNNLYGISGIASDITERVKYQEQLITAREGAENAKNLQEHFLANMSHEIRTPMNGIQGMTDLLIDTDLNKEQLEFTKTIKQSADSLLVIINDILDFSKIKAGKLMIEQINFRPLDTLAGIEKVFKHKLLKKGLTLKSNVAGNVPEVLCGDPHRLNQVLVNLVGNALKFTEVGNITVDVNVGASDESGITLFFKVTDTGIGIKEDKITDIFQSFTQAGSDITRKYGGSGLGLAICRQLLQLQGGEIEVTSDPGKGSCFTFHIYYGFENISLAEAAMKKNIVGKEILAGRRFLIAEDNRVNQMVIFKLIQRSGGLAEVVNNGAEAIAKLNAGNDYDIIIMDLQMPEMDGYTATNIIRNEMELKIPIIAMTATAMKGEKIKCIKAGMNEYLSKPFVFDHFYQSVYNVVTQASNSIGPTNKNIRETGSPAFSLALLDEMEDEEYTIDILETFIKQTPAELDELYNAAVEKDYIKVTAVAHKLKGSTGLLQIFAVTALLESIERDDHSLNTTLPEMVNKVIKIYADIEKQLVRRLSLMTKKPQNV